MDDQQLRVNICDIGKRAVADRLVVGTGGNLSARVGADGDVYITPTGYRLDELQPAGLAIIGADGRAAAGTPKASSESPMHLAAYRARPDVHAVIHLHPPFATLLHAIGREIRLITLDHAYYVREIATVGYHHSGTDELADAVADQLANADVVLIKHHGCLVVGKSLDRAYLGVLNLEEAAKATHRALLVNDRDTVCPPEYLKRVRRLEAADGSYAYGKT